MEQIIITRKSGTTYPLAVKKQATVIRDAKQSWGLLGDDVVNITVESAHPQHYEIGDYFNVFGRTYRLNQLPKVRKAGVYKYTYELTFEGVQYDLLRAFYDVTIETTGNTLQDVQGDTLTGNLQRFATVLVSNANRVFPGKWKLGACPDTVSDKTLTFGDGDNCLAVYQNLCQTFEVEADIVQKDGVCTINFYKRVGTTHPFVFEFGKGKGLYALDRQNVDSSNIVTRLKVFGSDDNITNKYRANRLCLPGKSKAQSFIEQAEAVQKYGVHEARKIFEDIKPTFNGKVSEIVANDVLQFRDSSMFDLNAKEADGVTTKYLITGVSAKIHFNTGNLAGYEFDIHKYDHVTKTFTLKKQTDDRGDVFPSASSTAFQFSVGDEYKILDVSLPERYQEEAEQKLQEQGNEYYRQNCQPKVKYGLSVTKSYLKKLLGGNAEVTLFTPGDYINIKDESIGVDKAVRIQSLVRNLLDVYDYTLTLSDVAENNITTRVISELIDLDKITTMNDLRDPSKARANWRTSREVLNMVFDADGDYYTEKIKPLSIDTQMLSVGARSMQFGLLNTKFNPNAGGNPNRISWKGGVLSHYTINDSSVVSWIMADGSQSITDSGACYLYAKCVRNGYSGMFMFSTRQIKFDEDKNHYHFLVGTLSSVDMELNIRTLSLTYGFTTINGKTITTGKIATSDGENYIDLDGNKFRLGDSNSFMDWNVTRPQQLTLHNVKLLSRSGVMSDIGYYRGVFNPSYTYHRGDEVSYEAGGAVCTYRYINAAPSMGHLPTEQLYWDVISRGKDGKDGASVSIRGSAIKHVNTIAELPNYAGAIWGRDHYLVSETRDVKVYSQNSWTSISASIGDGWIAEDTGHLWVLGQNGWSDVGRIKGEQGEPGVKGEPGESPASIYRGEYENGKTYYGTVIRRDIVNRNGVYYIADIHAGGFSNILPESENDKWLLFGAQFESVATGLLLAENANIAGWVFRDGKLYSQDGKCYIDGVTGDVNIQGRFIGSGKFTGKDGMFVFDVNAEERKLSVSGPELVQDYGGFVPQSGCNVFEYLKLGEFEHVSQDEGGVRISPFLLMKIPSYVGYKSASLSPFSGIVLKSVIDNPPAGIQGGEYITELTHGYLHVGGKVSVAIFDNLPSRSNAVKGQLYREGELVKIKT